MFQNVRNQVGETTAAINKADVACTGNALIIVTSGTIWLGIDKDAGANATCTKLTAGQSLPIRCYTKFSYITDAGGGALEWLTYM